MSCEKCTHNEACKYKEEHKKIVELVKEIDAGFNFKVKVDCRWYCGTGNTMNELLKHQQYGTMNYTGLL